MMKDEGGGLPPLMKQNASSHHKMPKYNKNKFNTTFDLGIRKRKHNTASSWRILAYLLLDPQTIEKGSQNISNNKSI